MPYQKCKIMLVFAWLGALCLSGYVLGVNVPTPMHAADSEQIYLPLVKKVESVVYRPDAPHFTTADVLYDSFDEMAIFWFGRITPTENAMDVRVGYNDTALYVNVAVFDRLFWYDQTDPVPEEFTSWDSVSLYFDTEGNMGSEPNQNTFSLISVNTPYYDNRQWYQAAYQGTGGVWTLSDFSFTTRVGARGEGGYNTGQDNRAWVTSFIVPFASLGLSSPPPEGSIWGLALAVHDRDDAEGTSIPDKIWPENIDYNQPYTWGQVRFGAVNYTPPAVPVAGTTTLRQEPGGLVVPDGAVGGGFNCGIFGGRQLDFWTEWGEYVQYIYEEDPSHEVGDFNVGNGVDIADWPCFSKYFTIFPLDSIPPNKVIISATLTLHQFGSSGNLNDPDPGNRPQPSPIQILTIDRDFDETTLNFNNAPLARENIAMSYVNPTEFPGWPGIPHSWDISYAVAEAYAAGEPLRLAIYSADGHYHSGRYFTSSDTDASWNLEGRPIITITWGNP
jgi:hypothetical protein